MTCVGTFQRLPQPQRGRTWPEQHSSGTNSVTVPDTHLCHPFFMMEPLSIAETPDGFVIGCQPWFATRLVKDGRYKSRAILVLSSAQTDILVLVGPKSLGVRIVRRMIFGTFCVMSSAVELRPLFRTRYDSFFIVMSCVAPCLEQIRLAFLMKTALFHNKHFTEGFRKQKGSICSSLADRKTRYVETIL